MTCASKVSEATEIFQSMKFQQVSPNHVTYSHSARSTVWAVLEFFFFFFGGRSDTLYAKTAIVISSVCDLLPLDTFGTLVTYIFDVLQWEFQDPKMDVLYHIRPYAVGIFPYIGLI